MPESELILVGEISGVFGIKGWLKVFSFTGNKDNILGYSPWLLKKGSDELKSYLLSKGSLQNKSVIAKLDGIDDRDQAASLVGCSIYVNLSQLPALKDDEYYWSDLVGLNVKTSSGIPLGVVDSLLETGANDVLIVKGDRERAIPFLQGSTILDIDLETRLMTVDWDADF